MNRSGIEAEILAWIEETPWTNDDERFQTLALALFRVQFEECRPYGRFCESLGRTPASVETSTDIPALPTGAFKEFDIACFPLANSIKTFHTSGTSIDRRGTLHLDTLKLYEASLLASLRILFLGELEGQRPTMRFLAPSPKEASDSSLTHMFETLRIAEGNADSGFDLQGGELDVVALRDGIRRAGQGAAPILVLGTSFAFVHLLDTVSSAAAADWKLPSGSRVMETGGFKGRSREVPADVLRESLAQLFDIPVTSVVNQYGMTELGSQFYDSTATDPIGPRRKLAPPWTRVRIIEPSTGQDVEAGEAGMIIIHDLANTGSVAAIQTADLGRSILDADGNEVGFSVLGRFEGAEQRGCSIATDVMLEASKRSGAR